MRYRPDIDGLRSVAVLSVILFHINNTLLPGGFVGVDIFFVISGFLITGIIADGISTDSFSMVRFYSRRVRRIFPALFLVLFFSLLFAVVTFEPATYERFIRELRYAALQISNFVFSRETGYFDAANETSPLLHTWSLGVEEQFYLIWPLLLLFLHRFLKNRRAQTLFVLSCISFIYSDHVASSAPQIAFYMLPSRAWELGLGGMLAVAAAPVCKSGRLNNFIAFLGLLLVLTSVFLLNDSYTFPGRWALPAVVGAVLLICSGTSRNTVLYRVLSMKPFVFTGKISYSLYLWHWPIIVFYKELVAPDISFTAGLVILLLTLILSLLSYFLVEKPCRYGVYPQLPQKIYTHIAGATVIRKVGYVLILALILPLTATSLLSCFNRMEGNTALTSVAIEVELLKSDEQSKKEAITLYWTNRDGHFEKGAWSRLYYRPENVVENNLYRFVFKLPDLSEVGTVRLDPLDHRGEVRVVSISLTEGIFNLHRSIEMSEVAAAMSGEFNLKAKYEPDTLLLESLGEDPQVIIFQSISENILEKILFFMIFLCILSLTALSIMLFGSGHGEVAALLTGSVVIIVILVGATRLQYSSHAGWRFLDDEQAALLLEETPMTDLSIFAKPAGQDVILLGDSHVGSFAWPVEKWSRENGFSFGLYGLPACPPVFYDYRSNGKTEISGQYSTCANDTNRQLQNIIDNDTTRYVFIAIRHEFYMAYPEKLFHLDTFANPQEDTALEVLKASIVHTIQALAAAGKNVIILGQVPVLNELPKTCLSRNVTLLSAFSKTNKSSCDMNKEKSDVRLKAGNELFRDIAEKSSRVCFFESAQYLDTLFAADGSILYYDDNHLSHKGSVHIYPFIEEFLKQADKHDFLKTFW